jgi:hypothetical protein
MSEVVATDARCGRCGYSTVGLATMTCPECGGDLREVGVVPVASYQTGRRRGAVLAVNFILYSLLLWLMWQVCARPLAGLVPAKREYEQTMMMAGLMEGTGQQFTFTAKATRWSERSRDALDVSIENEPIGKLTPSRVRRGKLEFSPGEMDDAEENVLRWFSSLGIDATNPQVRREANRVGGLARRMSRPMVLAHSYGINTLSSSQDGFSGALMPGRIDFKVVVQPPVSIWPILYAAWALLWLAGFYYLVRMRSFSRGQQGGI